MIQINNKHYSVPYFVQMMKNLEPLKSDKNYKELKKQDLTSKDWMTHLFRSSFDKTLKHPKLTKIEFYKNWLSIIKNELNRHPNSFYFRTNINPDDFIFGSVPKEFEEERNHALIEKIDWALIDAFGFPAYILLILEQMAYSITNKNEFTIEFYKTSLQKQTELIRDFDIRPMHEDKMGPIENDYLEGMFIGKSGRKFENLIAFFTSVTIFGFYHQFWRIEPKKRIEITTAKLGSPFLKQLFTRFEPRSAKDYRFTLAEVLDIPQFQNLVQ